MVALSLIGYTVTIHNYYRKILICMAALQCTLRVDQISDYKITLMCTLLAISVVIIYDPSCTLVVGFSPIDGSHRMEVYSIRGHTIDMHVS